MASRSDTAKESIRHYLLVVLMIAGIMQCHRETRALSHQRCDAVYSTMDVQPICYHFSSLGVMHGR